MNPKFITKVLKTIPRDRFRKSICNLKLGWNMLNTKMLFSNMITDIVNIKGEVLGFGMKDGIGCE